MYNDKKDIVISESALCATVPGIRFISNTVN